MRLFTTLTLLAVFLGVQSVHADDDDDDFKHGHRHRSGFVGRQWQPPVAYPPYRPTHYGTPSIGVPPIAGPSFAHPGIGYPSYAPQPNHIEASIQEWYLKYLGRYPDAAAIRSWVDFVYGRGRGQLSEVQIGIMSSQECFQRCNFDPATYVQFLIVQITGRQPSPHEMQTWVSIFYERFGPDRGLLPGID